jgi:hypothetical protein
MYKMKKLKKKAARPNKGLYSNNNNNNNNNNSLIGDKLFRRIYYLHFYHDYVVSVFVQNVGNH